MFSLETLKRWWWLAIIPLAVLGLWAAYFWRGVDVVVENIEVTANDFLDANNQLIKNQKLTNGATYVWGIMPTAIGQQPNLNVLARFKNVGKYSLPKGKLINAEVKQNFFTKDLATLQWTILKESSKNFFQPAGDWEGGISISFDGKAKYGNTKLEERRYEITVTINHDGVTAEANKSNNKRTFQFIILQK